MSNWKKNGWMTKSKQPVKNREDLEELDEAMNSGKIQVLKIFFFKEVKK